MLRETLERIGFGLCAGIASLALAGAASANHVDFIVDGAFAPISATSSSGVVGSTQIGAGGNILNTEREVFLSVTGGGTGFVAAATTSGVASGAGPVGRNRDIGITFSTDSVTGGSLDILLDGVGSAGLEDGNPGPGIDFDTNWNFLQVYFASVDVGADGDATLTVVDDAGNSASLTQNVTAAGEYYYAFPDFTGVDFTQVRSVNLNVTTNVDGSDFVIGEITREVVPEPGTALLLGLGLIGLGMRRRS